MKAAACVAVGLLTACGSSEPPSLTAEQQAWVEAGVESLDEQAVGEYPDVLSVEQMRCGFSTVAPSLESDQLTSAYWDDPYAPAAPPGFVDALDSCGVDIKELVTLFFTEGGDVPPKVIECAFDDIEPNDLLRVTFEDSMADTSAEGTKVMLDFMAALMGCASELLSGDELQEFINDF